MKQEEAANNQNEFVPFPQADSEEREIMAGVSVKLEKILHISNGPLRDDPYIQVDGKKKRVEKIPTLVLGKKEALATREYWFKKEIRS